MNTASEQNKNMYKSLGKGIQQVSDALDPLVNEIDRLLKEASTEVYITVTVNALVIALFQNIESIEALRRCRKGIDCGLDKIEAYLEENKKN